PGDIPGTTPDGDDSQPGDIPGTTPDGDDSQPGDISGTTPGGEDSQSGDTSGTASGQGEDSSQEDIKNPEMALEDQTNSSNNNMLTAGNSSGTVEKADKSVDDSRDPAAVTGDHSPIGLTAFIMILALGAIVTVIIISRKNYRKK
ncbi:hypothetical protein H6B11_15720, partial [Mediterraneibacter glycyrrhizinilyticus]